MRYKCYYLTNNPTSSFVFPKFNSSLHGSTMHNFNKQFRSQTKMATTVKSFGTNFVRIPGTKRSRLDNNVGRNVKVTGTRGFHVNHVKCEWTINHFDFIRRHNILVNNQHFILNVTDCNGVASTWLYYLRLRPASRQSKGVEWITIGQKLLKIEQVPGHNSGAIHIDKIHAQTVVSVQDNNGKYFYRYRGDTKCTTVNGKFYLPVMQQNSRSQTLPLINGALVVKIYLKVSTAPPPLFQQIGTNKLFGGDDNWEGESQRKTIASLVHFMEWNCIRYDVTLICKDAKKIPAHRSILCAASPVFQNMFKSGLLEDEIGEIKCDNLSAKCVNILVQYIYSGILLESWCDPDVVSEVVYGADKFILKDLLRFLDKNLGQVCIPDGVENILRLVRRLSLKEGDNEIFTFVGRLVNKGGEEILQLLDGKGNFLENKI